MIIADFTNFIEVRLLSLLAGLESGYFAWPTKLTLTKAAHRMYDTILVVSHTNAAVFDDQHHHEAVG